MASRTRKAGAAKPEAETRPGVSRRGFLGGAPVRPPAPRRWAIVKAQGPVTMRWQSTWPTKDIFHEFAGDFVTKVNNMSGGDLKIELLPAGAVVKAFDLIDAVSKGTLDGGHGVIAYWYGKNSALALWGSGPAWGMDPNMLLAWHKYGGGKELQQEIHRSLSLDGTPTVAQAESPQPRDDQPGAGR